MRSVERQRTGNAACVGSVCHGEGFPTISRYAVQAQLIEANFGVIDAKGGAAMFEVDYYEYVMYDANNPKDAPCGTLHAPTSLFRQGE